jgi:peptidyl-prolyl cis-trans isomerase A (cyclophilin A)
MSRTAWILAATAFIFFLSAGLPPAAAQDGEGDRPIVLLETTMGDIRLELDHAGAPKTVENFLRYVKAGFYEGTLFHRVIEGFIIQGGGYTSQMNQKTPLYPSIPLECRNGLRNLRGTIAMARGREPDSATSQFFINVVDNPSLDFSQTTNPNQAYAVFGRVIEGMDVVDRISRVSVKENPTDVRQDGSPAVTLPATPVRILRARTD